MDWCLLFYDSYSLSYWDNLATNEVWHCYMYVQLYSRIETGVIPEHQIKSWDHVRLLNSSDGKVAQESQNESQSWMFLISTGRAWLCSHWVFQPCNLEPFQPFWGQLLLFVLKNSLQERLSCSPVSVQLRGNRFLVENLPDVFLWCLSNSTYCLK